METLATTDIFDLLDMAELDENSKRDLLVKMQQILLSDFFTFDVPGLLSEEEKNELEQKLKDVEDPTKLLEYLGENIPDVEEILYKKSINFKGLFIKENIKKRIDTLKDKIDILSSGVFSEDSEENEELELEKTRNEHNLLSQVYEKYLKGDWEGGLEIIKLSKQ